jgi:hypothetical protein
VHLRVGDRARWGPYRSQGAPPVITSITQNEQRCAHLAVARSSHGHRTAAPLATLIIASQPARELAERNGRLSTHSPVSSS